MTGLIINRLWPGHTRFGARGRRREMIGVSSPAGSTADSLGLRCGESQTPTNYAVGKTANTHSVDA